MSEASTGWYEARVASNHPAAEGLFALSLDVRGTPLATAHTLPGQYVKLALGGLGEGFFAIAPPPHREATHLDFLIKGGAPLPEALKALPPGQAVRVSAPSGKGFP